MAITTTPSWHFAPAGLQPWRLRLVETYPWISIHLLTLTWHISSSVYNIRNGQHIRYFEELPPLNQPETKASQYNTCLIMCTLYPPWQQYISSHSLVLSQTTPATVSLCRAEVTPGAGSSSLCRPRASFPDTSLIEPRRHPVRPLTWVFLTTRLYCR